MESKVGEDVVKADVVVAKRGVRKLAPKADIVLASDYDDSLYLVQIEVERNGKIAYESIYKPEYRTPVGKCKIRASKRFNVPVAHLGEAYQILNGKKIDGFLANDLIDRYGFNKGKCMNRADLASKYGYANPFTVEMAEKKLGLILREADTLKAYGKYVGDVTATIRAEIEEKAVLGG
jgi:hypothetical protein